MRLPQGKAISSHLRCCTPLILALASTAVARLAANHFSLCRAVNTAQLEYLIYVLYHTRFAIICRMPLFGCRP